MTAREWRYQGHRERGALVLSVVVIIPLLLIAIVIAVELSTFFRVRESLRIYLDQGLRSALRQGYATADVVRTLQPGMSRFSAVVSSPVVQVTHRDGVFKATVLGDYQGIADGVLWKLLSGSGPAVKMAAHSSVRRVRSASLILLDRTIPTGRDLCDDPDFTRVKRFVSDLVTAMSSGDDSQVEVALLPTTRSGVVFLSAIEQQQGIDECSLTNESLLGSVSAAYDSAPDPVTFSAELQTAADEFFARARSPEVARVYIVTRQEGTKSEMIEASIPAIDRVVRQLGITPSYGHVAFGSEVRAVKWSRERIQYTRIALASTADVTADLVVTFAMPTLSTVVSE